MHTVTTKTLPAWEKELNFLSGFEKVINFEGHVNDKYLSFDRTGYSTLSEFIIDMLKSKGYTNIKIFNPVSGFISEEAAEVSSDGRPSIGRKKERGISALANTIFKELNGNRDKKAFIVQDASYLCVSNTHLSNEEHDDWAKIRGAIRNDFSDSRVFFIFENASDIPRALDEASGLSKKIIISKPDNTQRKQFVSLIFPDLSDDDIEHISDIAADIPLCKLQDVFQEVCSKTVNPGKAEIEKYIKQYIYGYSDSPWEALSKAKVLSIEAELNKQIKGQGRATKIISDKVKTAWSGIESALNGEKAPKGIAVLCGSTGVGKTELAVQLTRIVMGDPNLLIRIDANEYAQEHTAQRLIGSPPGYVGYEQGGQLTNAVNERPFSIILIDEIEKAHPAFWDYFIQILQDGRLTDGRGNLCVFNNTFLLFTTNLGAKEAAEHEGENTEKIIYEAIESYFANINRREIFGRLKKHIVAFDSITDDVACQIVEKQLKNFENNLFNSKGVKVNFASEAIQAIKDVAGHASKYGGRDIKNMVNECLGNQFVEIYQKNSIRAGATINVTGADKTDGIDSPLKFIYSVDSSGVVCEEKTNGNDILNAVERPQEGENVARNVVTVTKRRRVGVEC